MKCCKWITVLAVAVAAMTLLALAGEGKKCMYTTQECLDHMANKMKSGGWVGLELEENEATGGYTVMKVISGSPAESAGIQPGDLLYALNGVRISEENQEALKKAKKDWKPGQSVTYTIKRNGADREVNLTLAPMPADVLARWIGQHMMEHATVEVAAK